MRLTLAVAAAELIAQSKAAGKAEQTLADYRRSLTRLAEFLRERRIYDLRDVDRTVAEEFARYAVGLRHYRSERILSSSARARVVSNVKKLFRSLYLQERLLADPFEHVSLPRRQRRIPRTVLSEEEVEALLEALQEHYGLFGRLVGELFYGTGLRLSELRSLRMTDIDLSEALVFVKEGKGGKDRLVPMPAGTVKVLRSFLRRHRGRTYLFEKLPGRAVSKAWISVSLRKAGEEAGIEKKVTAHGLRHSFATHLLARGMDLRYIQQLLGHEQITTTEIYTRVRDEELMRVYRLSHPRG
jgi:site-specific recombinase XerD